MSCQKLVREVACIDPAICSITDSHRDLGGVVSVQPGRTQRLGSGELLQHGSGLVLLLPILQVRSRKHSFDWLDRSLLWLSIIFTAYTFTRPALIWLLGYSDLRSLPRSPYWILTLVSILNFSLLFTVVMTAIAVKETVDKLRKERESHRLPWRLNS